MSLSRETMIDLMALADGELEGADRERVERIVAENVEAQRVVDAMRSPAIGSWLEGEMAERTAAAEGIAGAVMARLPARRRSPVVVISIGAALALAAGVALILRSQGAATPTHEPVASVETPSVDVQPPPAAVMAQQRPTQGVEVDEVDSPSRGISVFEIPVAGAAAANAKGPSSVVIMIEDEGKK
jgi:hypothetical protein